MFYFLGPGRRSAVVQQQSADSGQHFPQGLHSEFIDVFAIPTIVSFLHEKDTASLRQTSRALCGEVDKHIDSLYLSFQGSKDVGLAKRLANRGLQPTKVSLGVGPRKRLAKGAAAIRAGSNALTAMLVSEQHCQLLKRATDISFGTDCTLHKKALHGLARNAPSLTTLSFYHRPLYQDAPSWRDLFFRRHKDASSGTEPLPSDLFPSLRSLHIFNMEGQSVSVLANLTQLQSLVILGADLEQASTLAQLTGLTHLCITCCATNRSQRGSWSVAVKQQLADALKGLTSLHSLDLEQIPPGPVAGALAGLTRLTTLTFERMFPEQGHLVLRNIPSLQLTVPVTPEQLLCLDAPQLQSLEVQVKWTPGSADDLRRLCRGVLRACNNLTLQFPSGGSQAVSAAREGAVEWMSVLHNSWKPTMTAEHWALIIWKAPICARSMSLLPMGLTDLWLWNCTLDPDSLDPLAQLTTMRSLFVHGCSGMTPSLLGRLLRTAVQGSQLKVTWASLQSGGSAQESLDLHQEIVKQQGKSKTPQLEV